MTSIVKNEMLYHAWKHADMISVTHMIIILVLCAIIGATVGLILGFALSDNDGDNTMQMVLGIIGLILGIAFLARPIIVSLCGTSYADTYRVPEQNIRILKNKRKLPHLKKLRRKYNHIYEYNANSKNNSNVDNNLIRQQDKKIYKKKFNQVSKRIMYIDKISSKSYTGKHVVTQHGGLYKVRKPQYADTWYPKRYAFKANQHASKKA